MRKDRERADVPVIADGADSASGDSDCINADTTGRSFIDEFE
jgi:hypothetical protein